MIKNMSGPAGCKQVIMHYSQQLLTNVAPDFGMFYTETVGRIRRNKRKAENGKKQGTREPAE